MQESRVKCPGTPVRRRHPLQARAQGKRNTCSCQIPLVLKPQRNHTHTPPRCSKSRHTKQNPDEEISIQMCCLRLHEKYRHTQRENVKHARRCQSPCSATWACASVSVQVHGAPPSIHKTPTMLTVRPKTATDSQDAHTCNRGRPCQNSGGSL